MSKQGNDHPHVDPHFDVNGGCACPCSDCTTSLRLCVCAECVCEGPDDPRHEEHVFEPSRSARDDECPTP